MHASIHPSIFFHFIWGRVAEVAASAGKSRLPFSQLLLPSLGRFWGVPRPAKRQSLLLPEPLLCIQVRPTICNWSFSNVQPAQASSPLEKWHSMFVELASAAGDWTAKVPVFGCHQAHTAPHPFGPFCVVNPREGDSTSDIWALPGQSHRQRSSH